MTRREDIRRPRQERTGEKPSARELRRIIVWTEILGKPLARRTPRFK